MSITFNEIPNNQRVPFVAVEFDNSRAVQGSSQQPFKILYVGQRLDTGSKKALELTRITNQAEATKFFGSGSMLCSMLSAGLKANNVIETWAIALDDNPNGVQATGSIGFEGKVTKTGTITLYIAGNKIEVLTLKSDTPSTILSKLNKAINYNANLSVISSVKDRLLHITAKHKGENSNFIGLRFGYYDEELPEGITSTINPMSGGTSNPDISPIFPLLGDEQYNIIVMPYTDASNLNVIETELTSRWSATRQIEGHAFSAANLSHARLATLGNSRNSKHLSLIPTYKMPQTPEVIASVAASISAFHLSIDPARPLQTLELPGILPANQTDRFDLMERNLLLYDGISSIKATSGGKVAIERIITTYKKNNQGADDPSYLDINTLFTLSYLRYDFRNLFLRKYARHKLAGDNAKFAAGQKVITPKVAKAEAVSWFSRMEKKGLVEGLAQFKEDLIVERNESDPNRLDFKLSPDLINQARGFAAQFQFLI